MPKSDTIKERMARMEIKMDMIYATLNDHIKEHKAIKLTIIGSCVAGLIGFLGWGGTVFFNMCKVKS